MSGATDPAKAFTRRGTLIQRDDGGRAGVLHHFNSKADRIQVNGGVRHIARSMLSVD